MKAPVIRKSRTDFRSRRDERGVTMVLVAVAMIAIIAMAALSIDVISLYLVREEAQRSADAAALAAARVISISGMTGDPTNATASWGPICGGSTSAATQAATAVAKQSAVGGTNDSTVNVNYSAGTGTPVADCTSLTAGGQFSVNPLVTVQITRAGLPSFFSRIWGSTGHSVSATSVAEVFNPSASDLGGGGSVIPVQPGCVKPWVVPNRDPLNPPPAGTLYCDQNLAPACSTIVSTTNGAITHPGTSLGGTGTSGIVGETFWLTPNCTNNPTKCNVALTIPKANAIGAGSFTPPAAPNLVYLPNQLGTTVVAIPACSQSDPYEEAIEGCDSPNNYQCGVTNANTLDLTRNPSTPPNTNPTTTGVQCLIHQTDVANVTSSSGQDTLSPFAAPGAFPIQMLGGSNNPLVLLNNGLLNNPISSSNSIVSLPIYDSSVPLITTSSNPQVTFVGFLQVFVNAVDTNGNVNVTVLNVAGCGASASGNPVTGTSPVPIRLVTPP
jgi:Flp pilus assembly protein TadG